MVFIDLFGGHQCCEMRSENLDNLALIDLTIVDDINEDPCRRLQLALVRRDARRAFHAPAPRCLSVCIPKYRILISSLWTPCPTMQLRDRSCGRRTVLTSFDARGTHLEHHEDDGALFMACTAVGVFKIPSAPPLVHLFKMRAPGKVSNR